MLLCRYVLVQDLFRVHPQPGGHRGFMNKIQRKFRDRCPRPGHKLTGEWQFVNDLAERDEHAPDCHTLSDRQNEILTAFSGNLTGRNHEHVFQQNPSAMMTRFYQRDVWTLRWIKTVLLNRRMHLQSEMMKAANQTKQPVSLRNQQRGDQNPV